jgi:hypothetical protein
LQTLIWWLISARRGEKGDKLDTGKMILTVCDIVILYTD